MPEGDVIVIPDSGESLGVDDLTDWADTHNPTAINDIKQNLYFAALEQMSGQSPWMSWVPSYGNYNGTNASVDLWVKWQAYNNLFGDGTTLTKDAAGQQKGMSLLSHYNSQYTNNDPMHLKPIDSQYWNGFYHDLGLTGGVITNILADVKFAINSFVSFIADGNLYSAIAAPFIGIVANAAHAVTGLYQAASTVGGSIAQGADALGDGFAAGLSSIAAGNFAAGLNSIISGIGNALAAIGTGLLDAFKALFPLVIDLDGDGLSLISIHESELAIVGADGIADRVGWVGASDGMLVYDADGDHVVDGYREFGLARFTPGASTDVEGMASFDTNQDGSFSPADAEFNRFFVWRDLNGDGQSSANELMTLAQAGVSSIGLTTNGPATIVDGNLVHGSVEVNFTDGRSVDGFDVSLASTNAAGARGFLTPHAQLNVMPAGYVFVTMDDTGSAVTLQPNMLPASVGAIVIKTGTGDDVVSVEVAANASITDAGGNDIFVGSTTGATFWFGAGNDVLVGSTGKDSYVVEGMDFGRDRIADSGGADFIKFAGELESFVCARHGLDLIISSVGGQSSVLIDDFYKAGHQIETFMFGGVQLDFEDLEQQGEWVTPSVVSAAWQHVPNMPGWIT